MPFHIDGYIIDNKFCTGIDNHSIFCMAFISFLITFEQNIMKKPIKWVLKPYYYAYNEYYYNLNNICGN